MQYLTTSMKLSCDARHRPEDLEKGRAARQADSPEPPPRDAPAVDDHDVMYIDYPAGVGTFRLELMLRDFENVDAWPEVTVSDIEITLLRTHGGLFPRGSRISLAANMRIMRGEEHVQELRREGQAFCLVPSVPLGSRSSTSTRRQRRWRRASMKPMTPMAAQTGSRLHIAQNAAVTLARQYPPVANSSRVHVLLCQHEGPKWISLARSEWAKEGL